MAEQEQESGSKAFKLMSTRKRILRSARGLDKEKHADKVQQAEEYAKQLYNQAQQQGGMTLDESHALAML